MRVVVSQKTWIALLVTACLPRQAVAQRVSSTVDFGAESMRYADSINASALSISPLLRLDWTRLTLRGGGTYAQLPGGHWSTQGVFSASVLTPVLRPLSAELALSTGGSAHWDGTRTGQSVAAVRGHFDAQHVGLWAGGGGGQMWDGFRWHPVLLTEFGAWTRAGQSTLIATVAPTAADDTIRYIDSELHAHFEQYYAELDALAGFRSGNAIAAFGSSSRSWGGAAITVWPTAHVGIVISGGTYPIDLTQGFPGGRYFFVSLRIGSRPQTISPSLVQTRSRAGLPEAGNGAPSLVIRRGADGAWELRVQAPTATRVELNGDFTGWQPIALSSRADDSWTVTLPLAPGTYQLNVRIDGGPWVVPAGILPVSDEFGGRVGVLVIP